MKNRVSNEGLFGLASEQLFFVDIELIKCKSNYLFSDKIDLPEHFLSLIMSTQKVDPKTQTKYYLPPLFHGKT